ncbi:MAG: phage tail tape measure protein [Thiobacillus sp.]|nr:phage tail tape measure protein [Thiobacillus sp.]
MATDHPVQISIGATLASSLGASVKSAQAQMGRLGSAMAEIESKSTAAGRLGNLREQAQLTGQAWRTAQAEVEKMKHAKASGTWTTKGVDSARARVAKAETKAADPSLSSGKQAAAQAALARARQSLTDAQAKADERYGRHLESAVAKAGRAKDAHDQLKVAVAAQTAALEKSGVATGKLAAEQVKLGAALDLLKTKTAALGQAQAAQQANLDKRAGYRGQIADAVALGGALYGLVQPAVAFEDALVGVRRVSGFTEAEYQRLGKSVLDLSTKLPMAADGLLQITAQGARVGMVGQELERFTAIGGRMAVAWGMSGSEAGKELSALQDAYKLTLDGAEQTADAINHLSNQMRVESADLFRILAKAGPAAREFGLSANQVAALGAAFVHMKAEPTKAAASIAAYVGGVFEGIRSAMQPAIESLSTALAPLAPIGNAVASAFGFVGDAVSGLVGWVSQLLAPVTLTQDEFDSMSVSGQSLGTIIGSVLGGAFTALTFPLRVVGTLVGWVIGALQSLAAFSPLAAISAGWQPVADFFTNLWSGITATVGQAIDWIASKIGWVLDAGKQVGDWFGALFGGDQSAALPAANRPAAVGSAISAAMPGVTSAAGATAHPLAQTAQPVAGRGTTSTSITAPITVNAPPGMDAREIASLIEARMRALMRETTRSPAAAMYD